MKKTLLWLFSISLVVLTGCSLTQNSGESLISELNLKILRLESGLNSLSLQNEQLVQENNILSWKINQLIIERSSWHIEAKEFEKKVWLDTSNINQQSNTITQKKWTNVYKDDKINFEISYLDTRNLKIENKTPIWEWIGKTLNFSKKWYTIKIIAYPQKHECWSEWPNPDSNRQKIQINWKTMFRQKQAYDLAGIGPWVTNNPVYIDFVDQWWEWCLMLDDKFFTFWYILPVSSNDFEDWKYSKEILVEMDEIISSLKW